MDKHNNNNAHKRPTGTLEPFKITGDWYPQSQTLQEKFPQLTDADLKFQTGKEEELLNRVIARLNKKREEVINIIKKGQSDVS